MKTKSGILILLLLISFGGCKTTQKIKTSERQIQAEQLFSAQQKAEPKYTSIEFKRLNISINLKEKNRYSSAANCKIIADSVIHISIQPFLGIEMFIVQLSPKQMTIVDKMQQVYYRSDYLAFYQKFGLDINYRTFEALLSNRFFTIPAKGKPEKDLISAKTQDGSKILSYKQENLNQHFFLNDDFRIKEVAVNSNSGNEQFMTFYTDFTDAGALVFPSEIRFQLKNKADVYLFNLSISRMLVNEDLNIPELNLNQYRKGDIMSLFR